MPTKQSIVGLNLVNIFMADVRDGVGVYLAVYLLTVQKWEPSRIGLVIAIPGLVSILAQSPVGNLIDRTVHKRSLLVLSSLVVALSCLVVIFWPTFYPLALSQTALGVVAPIFQPCVSAIALGLVGHQFMRSRVGLNETYNHLGNLLAALVAVALAVYVSFKGLFYFSFLQCGGMIAAVLLIRAQDIDHAVARSANPLHPRIGTFWSDARHLLADRNISYFILSLTLWNLANGAMLPLLGQKLGLQDPAQSAALISMCIITAQATMVVVAPWAAKHAHRRRKPLFILSFFLIAVRAALFATFHDRNALISFQVIDGIGAGIYGVLGIVMMADLSRGTGRFNLLQGITYAAMGAGGALSSVLGGYLAEMVGYDQCFFWLGAIGLLGTAVFALCVREPAIHD